MLTIFLMKLMMDWLLSHEDRLLLSGSKLRHLLSENLDVPDNFSRPEVLEILRKYYSGLKGSEKVKVELKGHSAK